MADEAIADQVSFDTASTCQGSRNRITFFQTTDFVTVSLLFNTASVIFLIKGHNLEERLPPFFKVKRYEPFRKTISIFFFF